MTITRRNILRGGMAVAALSAVPPVLRKARANGRADAKNLVLVLNFGGWDTTYVTDPKPDRPLVDTPPGAFRERGDLRWWSHASRPNVDTFFDRWGDRTAIVNGVQVRSFVHTDCVKRVMTGSPSETTPDMGAIAAWELGRDLPVPYLALGQQARSGHLASITGRTGTTNQLMALVDPEAAYAVPGSFAPRPGLRPTDTESGLVRRFLDAGAARLAATRGSRGYNRRRVEDFQQSLMRADRLARFARDSGTLGTREYTLDMDVQIPLAARALRDGLSHTVLIQSGYDWDTHADNSPQSGFHNGLYASLGNLMEQLESESVLDHTMVLVLSEMGRTPRLNASVGKDHWPATSCLMLGSGVRGGRVIGGTNDELGALSMDLSTGEPNPNGKQLQAANLVAGVLQSVGVDTSGYLPGVEGFSAFCA